MSGNRVSFNEEEEKEEQAPLVSDAENPPTYGANGNDIDDDNDDSDDEDDGGAASFRDSKMNLLSKLSVKNVMVSTRHLPIVRTESGLHDKQFEHVPTLLQEPIALVCDINLYKADRGQLYYLEPAFYHPETPPSYIVTMNPYIYQHMMNEVWRATTVPCGMYFCCQGGDGAHTGHAHADFVDIRLAWTLVGLAAVALVFISVVLPGDY